MASTGSRNGAGRAPTPTSPSPSPEPSGDPASSTGGAALSTSTPNPFQFGHGASSANGLGGSMAGGQNHGSVPFHELLSLEEDPNEPLRQQVEDRTRSVIDSLYQLAVCAADVQPGREDIVGVKVNDLVSHLSSLSSAASANHDLLPFVPEDVLEAIDEGRNPDVWSRNRMGRLVSDNQQIAGQRWAIEEFRQCLTKSVADVFPELAEEGQTQGGGSVLAQMEREHQALRARLDLPAEEAPAQGATNEADVKADVEMSS